MEIKKLFKAGTLVDIKVPRKKNLISEKVFMTLSDVSEYTASLKGSRANVRTHIVVFESKHLLLIKDATVEYGACSGESRVELNYRTGNIDDNNVDIIIHPIDVIEIKSEPLYEMRRS